MREPYDPAFVPPAPVLVLGIGRPGTNRFASMSALVDTGADITVVPWDVPGSLGLPVIGEVRVRAADGVDGRHALHLGLARLAGRTIHVEVVGMGAEALVGRDLLRRFVLTLDGPAGVLDITAS